MRSQHSIVYKTLGFLLFSLFLTSFLIGCANEEETNGDALIGQDFTLTQEVSASGEVVPVRWVTLSFTNGASDLELKIEVGQEVAKDDVLVESNDPRLYAALSQAQSALERAQFAYDQTINAPSEAALKSAEAVYRNARANLIRQENFLAAESVIEAAQADFDAAVANLKAVSEGATDQEVKAAEYDLEAAQLSLEKAEASLILRAPFGGRIVEVFINSGEDIGPSQPVVTLADLTELQVVTTDLNEVDVTRLDEGQKANIVFDALSDQNFQGTVIRIADRSIGVSSVYYEVTLTLDKVPQELRWGMTAFITFPVD